MVWHGTDLVTRWKTKKINGHIVECQIKDFENNGTEKIVAAVILDVSKGRGKSKLLVFDLR